MKKQKSELDDDDLVCAECKICGLTLDDVLYAIRHRKEPQLERRTLKVTLESADFTEDELRLIFEKILEVIRKIA